MQLCPQGCTNIRYCMWFRIFYNRHSACLTPCSHPFCPLLKEVLQSQSYPVQFPCLAQFLQTLSLPFLPTYNSSLLSLDIQQYASYLRTSSAPWWRQRTLFNELQGILNHIRIVDKCEIFHRPVDPSMEGCSDYYKIILDEMDLEKMEKRLQRGAYNNIETFQQDFETMIENCCYFNYRNPELIAYAQSVKTMFDEDLVELKKIDRRFWNEYMKKTSGRVCKLCEQSDIQTQPVSFFCSFCNQPILQTRRYFIDPSMEIICCAACYLTLPDTLPSNPSLSKATFIPRHMDSPQIEPWISCFTCKQWFHQKCVFFNPYVDQPGELFLCPFCHADIQKNTSPTAVLLRERVSSTNLPLPTVQAIPETELSRFMERRLQERITKERSQLAQRLQMELEDTEYPEQLAIRLVMNEETSFPMGQWFQWYYQKLKLPESIPYWQKCICLFQKQNGVDLLLFIMFVFECPEELYGNTKCAYISYFDSVPFLKPAHYRKQIHQEIVCSYLAYIKQHGFEKTYIWVCPPTKGNDFIFFSHPTWQFSTSLNILNQWYLQCFTKAMEEGIIIDVKNIVDAYHEQTSIQDDAIVSHLPLFADDYLVSLLDQKCKAIHEQDHKPFNPACETDGKGRLYQRVFEVLRTMKSRFILLSLQPHCTRCGVSLAGSTYYKDSKSLLCTPKNMTIAGARLYCLSCFAYLPIKQQNTFQLVHETPIQPYDRTLIPSRLFQSRKVFLTVCQANHFHFTDEKQALYSSFLLLYLYLHPSQLIPYESCSVCQSPVHKAVWYCSMCPFKQCASCRQFFPHEHAMLSVDPSSQALQDSIEMNLIVAQLETEREVDMKRVFLKPAELVVHCCNAEQVDAAVSDVLKQEATVLVKHVLQCTGCTMQLCIQVKELLQHALTCCTPGCPSCFTVHSLLELVALDSSFTFARFEALIVSFE